MTNAIKITFHSCSKELVHSISRFSGKKIYPLLLVLIIITSCNRHNKTDLPKDSVSEPKPISAGQPKIIKTQGTTQYDNVHCGLLDKAGNLWFGTTGEGVYRYDGKSFINFTENDGLCNNNVWSILEDTAGNIWFGTSAGVCRYDPAASLSTGSKAFINFTEKDGLCNNNVWSILEDDAGNIWFGTSSGVCRYDPSASLRTGSKYFTNFLSGNDTWYYDKRRYQVVESMLEDKHGNIWVGSWNNGGVFCYDGQSFTNFTTDDGFCDNMISDILEDKAGNILFVTRDYGVCSYDPSASLRTGSRSFISFSEKIGLPNNNIRCILEDRNGNIWFGTDGKMDNDGNGVYRYDPSAALRTGSNPITNFTTKDGLSNNNVFTIIEDNTGNIWFGTRNVGLCRYDGKSFTDFSE